MERRNIINLIKIIFGVLIILFLVSKIDISYISIVDFKSNIEFLVLSFLSFIFSLTILQSLRLNLLLKDLNVRLYESFKLVILGTFFNSFLPSNIGGDGYKIYYLKKRYDLSLDKSFALILIERISGLFILFLMGLVYIVFFWERLSEKIEITEIGFENKIYYIIAFFLMLILAIGITFLLKPKWSRELVMKIKDRLRSSLGFVRGIDRSIYLMVIFFSILIHFFRLLGFYFLVFFLNEQIYWIDIMFLLSITAFISMIPITLGALGLREGVITVILILFGLPENDAIIISLLNRLILMLIASVGAIYYMNSDFKLTSRIK
jgi:glycosyltransferase 2 family protein